MTLQPLSTAPRDGTYILLFGPSGYVNTPLRCEVGCYKADYAETMESPFGWRNHDGSCFLDGGEAPTHWLPLPEL